jgi:hypothetical protein
MNNEFTGASVTTDQVTNQVELPDWLSAPEQTIPISPTVIKAQTDLMLTQYEIVFMRVIEQIAAGRTFQSVIKDDFREFEHGAFLRWIKRDPERHQLYKEAKELRTETWANEMIQIADADDSIEDVARSKLRIDTRRWLMGTDNRKQYGEVKTIDHGGQISIIGALSAADNRVIDMADIEDVTPRIDD